VLSFVRRALATQTIPPNMAVVGLSLFLTVFTMAPTLKAVNRKALQPYLQDQISFTRAGEVGTDQLKQFMLRQTRKKDMQVFLGLAEIQPRTVRDIPMHVIIPSFAISEFRTAFEMGCLLFIPFLLIDMVVAGILLSAGMMMLPPMMVSLPFKIILFVLVDGWKLVVLGVVRSFN
jgi:flagellar biosynthetic protein FliP